MPVQVVLKARDATNFLNAAKDRMCYKRGDIVMAADKGTIVWGTEDLRVPADGGAYCIVEISDVTMEQLRAGLRNRWPALDVGEPEATPEYDTDGRTPSRRRRLHVDWKLLPAGVIDALWTTGRYVTTVAAVRQFIRNKITGDAL